MQAQGALDYLLMDRRRLRPATVSAPQPLPPEGWRLLHHTHLRGGIPVVPPHLAAWLSPEVRRGDLVHAWHVRLLDGSTPEEYAVLICGTCGQPGIFDDRR
jgi:hypothetical protein